MRLNYVAIISIFTMACGDVTSVTPDACSGASCVEEQTTLQVAVTGDDAGDGIAGPVKTLKRAIDLATANPSITAIHISEGEYNAALGETYNYAVPPRISIHGEPGTILAGATTGQTGLFLTDATLENLELRNFATAINVAGTTTLTNIAVTTSNIAVVTEAMANLTATRLKVDGTPAFPMVGVQAREVSQVILDNYRSTNALAVHEVDDAVVAITSGTITSRTGPLIRVQGKSLTVTDSSFSGGSGIYLENPDGDVTLERTVITDSQESGINGSAFQFQMTGGQLDHNAFAGAALAAATATLTNVRISDNRHYGVLAWSASSVDPSSVKMRGCSVIHNETGVQLSGTARGDFGTRTDHGQNELRENALCGLVLDTTASEVPAVGNTWNPSMQGSLPDGTYPDYEETGTADNVPGHNFAIFEPSPPPSPRLIF